MKEYCDLNRRRGLRKVESKDSILGLLREDKRVTSKVRFLVSNFRFKFKSGFGKLEYNNVCRIQNSCVFSGRNRSVVQVLRISRHQFKKLAMLGLVNGYVHE